MTTSVLPATSGDGIAAIELTPRIRPIVPTDVADLERFYGGLSGEDRRTRFLHVGGRLSDAQAVSFCWTDHDHRDGFVAVVADPSGHERIVGHLCLEPDGADSAEVAIAVAGDFQHRGVGRQLLAAGAAWAIRQHVLQLTATMFADNTPIQRLFGGLGRPADARYIGGGVTAITIDLRDTPVAA